MGISRRQRMAVFIDEIHAMMNRIEDLEVGLAESKDAVKLADSRNEIVNGLRTISSLENQIIRLRALIRSENMPDLFDINDDATTELAIEVAELKVQLARHAWHRIDPDDQGTWPEMNIWAVFFCEEFKTYSLSFVTKAIRPYLIRDYTHYRRIVGPEDGG